LDKYIKSKKSVLEFVKASHHSEWPYFSFECHAVNAELGFTTASGMYLF